MSPTIPPLLLFEDDLSRAAEAFRKDPKCRQALHGIWKRGRRYQLYPMELFVVHVLHYLGEDPRGWRDWTDAVCEGANVVLKEEGAIKGKGVGR